jgi:integrase
MMNYYFVLDVTYKKGTYNEVKKAIAEGQPVSRFFNDKETALYVATTYRGKYMKVNTGIKILPKDFDCINQKVKKSHPDYAQLNLLLHDYRYRLEVENRDKLLDRKNLTCDEIKAMMTLMIKGEKVQNQRPSFFSAFDLFMQEMSKTHSPGTIEVYHSVLMSLQDFSEDVEQLTFDSINKEFEMKFRNYSIEIKRHKNNTMAKNFRSIKVFFKWCFEKGYIDTQVYKQYKVKEDAIEVVYLTSEELIKIEGLDLIPFSRLDKIKDVFLFQLYTGQRYSDIQDLRYKDIDRTNELLPFWNNYQIKGKKTKTIRIPLSEKAIRIIDKYTKNDSTPQDFILPAPSNVKMNFYLKEVCQLAKIDEIFTMIHYSGGRRIETVQPKYKFISTHAARKSFITLSLERGMPKETIMKISGHEDDRAIKSYIKISEKFYTQEFIKAWG